MCGPSPYESIFLPVAAIILIVGIAFMRRQKMSLTKLLTIVALSVFLVVFVLFVRGQFGSLCKTFNVNYGHDIAITEVREFNWRPVSAPNGLPLEYSQITLQNIGSSNLNDIHISSGIRRGKEILSGYTSESYYNLSVNKKMVLWMKIDSAACDSPWEGGFSIYYRSGSSLLYENINQTVFCDPSIPADYNQANQVEIGKEFSTK